MTVALNLLLNPLKTNSSWNTDRERGRQEFVVEGEGKGDK
jgi:hypothetical protein